MDTLPQFKYLPYKQCLPGCFPVQSSTTMKRTTLTTNKDENVTITNDIQCQVYDPRAVGEAQSLKASTETPKEFTTESYEEGKE